MTNGRWIDQQTWRGRGYLEQKGMIASRLHDKVWLFDYWAEVSPRLPHFFSLAISLADLVGLTHEQHLIPYPFYPRSLLVEGHGRKLSYHPVQVFMPFNQSHVTFLPEEEEAKWYLAPEQFGPLPVAVDYRSNLYALGLFFYEMLAGRHPFKTGDVASFRHAHLARPPLSLYKINSSIPFTLSNIVDKLLAKQPEERYQSAFGLKADLERAYREWATQGYVSYFDLGSNDVSVRLNLEHEQGFFGRKEELETLGEAYARAQQHEPVLVVLSGEAGVGKSTLITHFFRKTPHAPIILVKCEQLKQHVPYNVVLQLLRQFLLKNLAGGEEQTERLKDRLKDISSFDYALLRPMLPEISLVLEKAPAYKALPSTESENRFRSAIQTLFYIMLEEAPFWILVLEDLQWMDEQSLELFHHVFQHVLAEVSIMVIVSHRPDLTKEVKNRLDQWTETFNLKGKTVRLPLNPLTLEHMADWFVFLFRFTREEAALLAGQLKGKSWGNPLYIKRVLQHLYEEHHLYFDHGEGKWKWNSAAITELPVADDLVRLLKERLERLSPDEQLCLKVASCLGIKGDYDVLARVVPPEVDLKTSLERPFHLGLISFSEQDEKRGDTGKKAFSFAHDQIWQSVFSSLSDEERESYYHKIGRILWEDYQEGRRVYLPELVKYLNIAQQSIRNPEERLKLSRLNLQSARQLMAAAAYQAAISLLNHALRWLEGLEDEELSFAIQLELAHCYYLAHRITEADKLMDRLLHGAPSPVHKLRVYERQLLMYLHLQKFEEGVNIGLTALRQLGLPLPKWVSDWQVAVLYLRVKRLMTYQARRKQDMKPGASAEHDKLLIRIVEKLSILLFFINPKLYAYLTLLMLVKVLKGEQTIDSPLLYINFALISAWNYKNIAWAERASREALKLVKEDYQSFRGHVHFVHAGFIQFWSRPYSSALPELDEGFEGSIQTGNDYVTMGPPIFKLLILLFLGVPLNKVMEEVRGYLQIFRQLNQPLLVDWLETLQEQLQHLQGASPKQKAISRKEKKSHALYNTEIHQMILYVPQLVFHYLHEEYDLLCDKGRKLEGIMNRQATSIYTHVYYFFYALGLVECYSYASRQERRMLKVCLAKLKELAKHSPQNALFSYLLVSAECLRLNGKNGKALKRYKQAVEALDEHNGYFSAIVYERKGQFEWQNGLKHSAKITLNEALRQYHLWGIEVKKATLLERYQAHLKLSQHRFFSSPSALIDHLSLIKASQDLSKEIVLSRLINKLLQNTIQNAGAQKGTLLLNREGSWQIEAEAILEENGIFSARMPRYLLEHYIGLPRSLIRYVLKTKKTVVIDDATQDQIFAGDDYVQNHEPLSVLCTPLIYKGDMIGLLYLENRLIRGAFTEEKVLIIQHLATQAAISLINAEMYQTLQELNQKLEEKVKERTARLKQSQEEAMKMLAERAVLEERRRISKEMHDVIGHALAIAIVQLETVKRLMMIDDLERAMEVIESSLNVIRRGHQELRRSIHMLAATDIDFDLVQELKQLINETQKSAGVSVDAHIDELPPLDHKLKKVIYHALMEGLTNGIRHAQAKTFSFDLTFDGEKLVFRLRNDGFIQLPVHFGFGLSSMKQAVENVGGSMEVEASPNDFLLAITFPWKG